MFSRVRLAKSPGVLACKTAKFLGERLRALRILHGLTQEQAADRVKTDYKYWQILEKGGKDIRLTTLEKIAGAFGLDVRDLFAETLPNSKVTQASIPPPHRRRRSS